LPSGPYKGKAADKKSVREDVQKYYAEAGWDENGVPKPETLKRFGLQKMDKSLEKMRQ